MSQINWKPAEVTPHSIPKGKAYARITPNSLTFNAVAANMIANIEDYPWAVVQVGYVDDVPTLLGFHFVKEETPDAFPVRKQSKKHKGITFFSKELIKRYFGVSGFGLVVLQQDVEKIDDTTLAVKLNPVEELENELNALDEQLGRLDI